jgi:hypothetical protein
MFCGVLRSGHLNTIRVAAKSVLQSEELAVGRLLNPSAAFVTTLHGGRQLSSPNHLLRKQRTPISWYDFFYRDFLSNSRMTEIFIQIVVAA